MTVSKEIRRSKSPRGKSYTLADFESAYRLDTRTARDLFDRFGPSAVNLDLLMAAKRRTPTIDDVTADLR